LLYCGGGARWLPEKGKRKKTCAAGAASSSRVPLSHWPSSRPPFPIDPHPFFLHRGRASTPRARRGVRSANKRRPLASSCGPNYGGFFPAVPKSSSLCCPESGTCSARRNNLAQVGSRHEQCTVRRGRIIPRRTSTLFHDL
jgi:hypothetical protein